MPKFFENKMTGEIMKVQFPDAMPDLNPNNWDEISEKRYLELKALKEQDHAK